ncbi:MAG: hypothetical protein AB7O59_08740 [Pirellulales bacterium]
MFIAAVALPLCLAQTLFAADHRQRFLERAPANACLTIYSADVAATCAAFRKTRIGEKLCGETFAPLVAELTKRDQASLLRLRPLFGFDWSELAAVHDPGGIVVWPLADGSLGAAWLFVPAEPLRETPPCLVAAADYFNQRSYRGTVSKRASANLSVYAPPADRQSEDARVLFATSTIYGVANSQAAADALLAVQPAASLTKQPALVSATAGEPASPQASASSDAAFFVKPISLWELMRTDAAKRSKEAAGAAKSNQPRQTKPAVAAETADEPREDEVAATRRLGLGAIESVNGTVQFATTGDVCEWTVHAALHVTRPYQGALRLLELRPGPLPELPTWAPADVLTLGRWRWDFPLAMKGFGSLYDEANEPGPDGEGLFEDMLDGLRDDPEGVQVDLRRELFEKLAPEMLRISVAGAAPESAQADSKKAPDKPRDTRQWLYMTRLTDAAAVSGALARFYRDDERVKRDKWGGYDVWTVGDNASLFVEGESDSLVTVRGLAVGEGQLLFSTDVPLLRQAIDTPQHAEPLTSDAAWNQLLGWSQKVRTEGAAFESLLQVDRAVEGSYRAGSQAPPPEAKADTKKPSATNPDAAAKPGPPPEPALARLWRLLLFGTAEGSPETPYAAAPAFDKLRDALPRGAIVMSQTADGWLLQFGVLGAGGKQF